MKTIVTGCNGQLGQALAKSVPAWVEFVGLGLADLDITYADDVLGLFRKEQPACVINCAAYTAVDQAENDADAAIAVNVEGTRNIAVAARDIGARLIHVSTDFVFGGEATEPYAPDSAAEPLSVYGRSKYEGELAVLQTLPDKAVIVRTSWLYSKTGGNFVKTMLRLMREQEEIGVVADQRGTPTWAGSLAAAIWAIAGKPELSGILHWTDDGDCSWFEFAMAIQEIALEFGLLSNAIPIHSIKSEDYPTAAARPVYSVLDCSGSRSAIGLRPDHWSANLRRMLEEVVT